MDYQRLARTLLRILSIWLIAQSLSGLVGGAILAFQMPASLKGTSSTMWTYPIMAGLTIAVGFLLFYSSEKLAKIISE
jgi:primosomal replication protein N